MAGPARTGRSFGPLLHLNLLFLLHGPIHSNSGYHVQALLQHLCSHGISARVVDPSNPPSAPPYVWPLSQLTTRLSEWRPDLVHLWTPRQRVVSMLEEVQAVHPRVPVLLHLEDPEEHLTRTRLSWSPQQWHNPPDEASFPPDCTHPQRYRRLLQEVHGVSVLTESLTQGLPKTLPTCCFAPSFDESLSWEVAPDLALRHQLGLSDTESVIVYCGNGHYANQEELRSLYLGIALAQEAGVSVRLIRTGRDHFSLSADDQELRRRVSIELGVVEREELPKLLALADLLIQPGHADAFNRFRFPSKLPEFLASGKAVVLPPCNLGLQLKDQQEAILLRDGSALGIRNVLREWLPQQERLRSIGKAGQAYAWQHLRWKFAAEQLAEFYRRVLPSD